MSKRAAAAQAPDGAAASSGLKVIGTGLGRTGTSSLKAALEILYPGQKCYHMKEVIGNGGIWGWFDFWTAMSKGEVSMAQLREHFVSGGYGASCDYPACLYWRQQLAAFPEAVVVHSTRSAASWTDSVLETIFLFNPDNPSRPLGVRLLHALLPFKVGRPMARMLAAIMPPQLRGDYSRAGLARTFAAWEAEVRADCPPAKLLVHEAKDGWAPLCKHLGLPVPGVPYPHVNDTEEMKKVVAALNAMGWITAALYAAAIAAAARKLQLL